MRHEVIVLLLWLIAVVTTLVITGDSGLFTYLGPVYAICMIGSVLTVRRARGAARG